jgi:hypothetical protein
MGKHNISLDDFLRHANIIQKGYFLVRSIMQILTALFRGRSCKPSTTKPTTPATSKNPATPTTPTENRLFLAYPFYLQSRAPLKFI